MNNADHPTVVPTGQNSHPMDVIVRAVETEGIQELLGRLKKRDIRRLLRECTNSETKPEGSKRALHKELEQRWVSTGVKKFLKKHINSHQNLNMLATALNLQLQITQTTQPQPAVPATTAHITMTPTTMPATTAHITMTDRISLIEAITREITTLGNQIFHRKVPNEYILSFIEAKQKQLLDEKKNALEEPKKKERKNSSAPPIAIPRLGSSESHSTTSPRKSGEVRKSPLNLASTPPSTSPILSPVTPEKKKQKKQDPATSGNGARVKQPKLESK